MFQAIKTKYSLDEFLPKKADAQLSDLFFILYVIYMGSLRRIPISIIGINKCIAEIVLYLEKERKLDEIKIFNVPFYKHQHGHCNEIIKEKYIQELLNAELIGSEPMYPHAYFLTDKSVELIEKYYSNVASENKKKIEKEIIKFIDVYMKDFDFGILKKHFHNEYIKDINGKNRKIHTLPIEKEKAIAYNASPKNFPKLEEGQASNIIPTEYLTALSVLLEKDETEDKKLTQEEKKYLDKIFN